MILLILPYNYSKPSIIRRKATFTLSHTFLRKYSERKAFRDMFEVSDLPFQDRAVHVNP